VTAPHFFSDAIAGDSLALVGEEARHARAALRIKAGETITVSDGKGTVVTARVVRAEPTFDAEIIDRRFVPAPEPRMTVMPAVPKSGKLDLVVEKLTELGIDEIRPWFAARTVVRWDTRKARAHGDRWRAIARAASKQSRRAWLPDVADPAPLGVMPAATIVLHEGTTLRLNDALADRVEEIGLVTGPEGGLSEEEVAGLRSRGAHVVALGEQILRTETAVIVAATLTLGRYGRIG